MNGASRTIWDLLALGLWCVFFAIGLVPEPVFYVLRDFASVTVASALVNSSAVITLALSAYFAMFAYYRCLEAGRTRRASQGRALQTAALALVAFVEIPSKGGSFEIRTLLELVFEHDDLPTPYLRYVVLFMGGCKLAAWWYLFSLVLRYHGLANLTAFANMPVLLPSARDGLARQRPVKPEPPHEDHANQNATRD